MPKVTDSSVARLIEYLPAFERGDFAKAVESYHETGQYSPEIITFFEAFGSAGLGVKDLNCIAWMKEEGSSALTDEGIAGADFLQLRKILTYCSTADRFSGGFLQGVFASGLVEAVLRRMNQIRLETGEGEV
jgi:Family of unknown function (DUF6508)